MGPGARAGGDASRLVLFTRLRAVNSRRATSRSRRAQCLDGSNVIAASCRGIGLKGASGLRQRCRDLQCSVRRKEHLEVASAFYRDGQRDSIARAADEDECLAAAVGIRNLNDRLLVQAILLELTITSIGAHRAHSAAGR